MINGKKITLTRYQIDIANQQQILPVNKRALRHTVDYVLRAQAVSAATVSVAVIDNETMRDLSKQFLQQSDEADVISFDLRPERQDYVGAEVMDCEILINAERAAAEAAQRRSDPQGELHLYLIHGLLHQLGYDDLTVGQARIMHEKEDQLLHELGFGRVYRGKE